MAKDRPSDLHIKFSPLKKVNADFSSVIRPIP